MRQDPSPLRDTLLLLLISARKYPGGIIWKQCIPERISLFVWRMLQKGLPVDANVNKIGVSMASRCLCCDKEEETMDHLFFQGVWATDLRNVLANVFDCARPDFVSSFIGNWDGPLSKKDARNILRFGLSCYGLLEIWRPRNNKLHGERFRFLTSKINTWAGQIISQIF